MSDSFRDVAVEAALQAGAFLRSGFGARHHVSYKGSPTNLVTEMDRGAETIILDVIRARCPGHAITEARAEMASRPYAICPEALPPLGQLVGLSISRDFTREVNERFGRQRGCAHFTALIHAMAPAVRQGAGVAFPD